MRASRWALGGVLAVAVLGCPAQTSIQQTLYADEKLDRPPLVLVYDFAVNPEDVVVDVFGPSFLARPASASQSQSRDRAVANLLAAAMVQQLRERGIPAERAGARTSAPRDAILVKGQFVSVGDEGEMPRMAIGLGSEASALRIQVQAYQVADDGLRRISERAVGGLGEPPESEGASAPGPVAVISGGLSFVLRSQENVEADTERLAELFSERTLEFYRRQGWLSSQSAARPAPPPVEEPPPPPVVEPPAPPVAPPAAEPAEPPAAKPAARPPARRPGARSY